MTSRSQKMTRWKSDWARPFTSEEPTPMQGKILHATASPPTFRSHRELGDMSAQAQTRIDVHENMRKATASREALGSGRKPNMRYIGSTSFCAIYLSHALLLLCRSVKGETEIALISWTRWEPMDKYAHPKAYPQYMQMVYCRGRPNWWLCSQDFT